MANIYYYVHTGHRFGLNRFRKAVAIIEALSEYKITLLTSDYRIASGSRNFGIDGAVGIDVFRNIPNVAEYGDILIYDSTEENEGELEGMIDFFSKFIRVTDDPEYKPKKGEYVISPYLENSDLVLNANPVSKKFFGDFQKSIETTFFFGDDDYDKDILKYFQEKSRWQIILGFYFFLGYEDDLEKVFEKVWETEDYDEVIQKSKNVVTSSTQTALNVLASGGNPIFFERDDRDSNSRKILEKYGIPVLNSFSQEKIETFLKNKLEFERILSDESKIVDFFKQIL
ncbi:hypothetical protein ThvES_00007030 [Thiovulum sp. ES]|nr:hypothetical protein ThvES_00007030 [Thiovulum sp. ES]